MAKKETKEKKPKSKARKIIEWIGTGIFGAALLLVLVVQIDSMATKAQNFGVPNFFGYSAMTVLTDSMEPKYPVGSMIVAQKKNADEIYKYYTVNQAKIESGDLYVDLCFFDSNPVNSGEWSPTNSPITHRLESITYDASKPAGYQYVFTIHGINTQSKHYDKNQKQQYNEHYLIGQIVFSSVFLGGVYSFATSWYGLLVLLLVPAFYLIITSVIDIFRAMKDEDEDDGKVVATVGDAPGDGSSPTPNENASKLTSLSDEEKARLKAELLQQMLNDKKNGGSK